MKPLFCLAPIVFLAVHAQDADQGHLDRLSRFHGNKLVLLGNWAVKDTGKWRDILASTDMSEYGFTLLDRSNAMWLLLPNSDKYGGMDSIEAWLRRLCGSPAARWVALDASNKVISFGKDAPDAKALASSVEAFGIKSALRQLRDFLKLRPDHLDARADLLKEVRRRALLALPPELNGDMDKGDDLRTWGVLAREIDLAMNSDWLGYKLGFFHPEAREAEVHSPLMKAAFRKHIGRVEDAIREYPTNENLWDTWAWMARGLTGDDGNGRPLFQFIDSLEPFTLPGGPTCPSPKVASWLTQVARSKGDWDAVIRMAKLGRGFDSNVLVSNVSWSPGLFQGQTASMPIEGYPEKSSYYPHIEALFKLGRPNEADVVFNEMLRIAGPWTAAGAADIAQANGYEDLAAKWSKGAPETPVPYFRPVRFGEIAIVVRADWDTSNYKQMVQLIKSLGQKLTVYGTTDSCRAKTLHWTGDDFRWALIGGDGLVLEQGKQLPTMDELGEMIEKYSIRPPRALAEEFLKKNPHSMEALLTLGIEGIINGVSAIQDRQGDGDLDSGSDDAIWGTATSAWTKILNDDRALFALPDFYVKNAEPRSHTMRLASKRFLPKIEAALARSPASKPVWDSWLFWRTAGGNERDFEVFLESIEPSPMELLGSCPPAIVFAAFYDECRKGNKWPQMVKLLKEPWDRGISKQLADNAAKEKEKQKPTLVDATLGDRVGLPLIEALLNIGRRQEADETFKSWLDCGGGFTNPAELIETARRLGGEMMAKEWERRLSFASPTPIVHY